MKLIKLDAIDSTNEFIKELSYAQELENFTVVTANKQSKVRADGVSLGLGGG
jgi:BirA family biotin operon repressor/biotin-[acetyl-CoA-carboxylase] ligase